MKTNDIVYQCAHCGGDVYSQELNETIVVQRMFDRDEFWLCKECTDEFHNGDIMDDCQEVL